VQILGQKVKKNRSDCQNESQITGIFIPGQADHPGKSHFEICRNASDAAKRTTMMHNL
jgi:hypothetical protein